MRFDARSSSCSRWRQTCLQLFALLLFVHFVLWSTRAIAKSRSATPAALGRRGIAPSDAASLLRRVAADVEAVGLTVTETASDVVLSDSDQIPLRKERVAESVAAVHASVPGVDDVFARLQEYLTLLSREHFYRNLTLVKSMQKRTKAVEMDAEPMDRLEDMSTLHTRIAFLNRLAQEAEERAAVRVSITTTSSVSLRGVRSELLPWMQYHTHLGVTHFYILYDGTSPSAVEALEKINHVTLMHIHPPFATEEEVRRFQQWTEMHKQWGGKPGNYELMVKQGYGTSLALGLARSRGDAWLLHIDPDELFYPDNAAFSLLDEFLKQPASVSSVRFMNFEGQPEFGDVTNRYEQVTLFRAHKYLITPEANYVRSRCKLGDNRTFLVLYANGKSAVRVDAPGVHQLGPHFFSGDPSDRWKTEDNPEGLWQDAISNTSFLLHYGYSYLSDVTKKAERSCPGDSFKRAGEDEDRTELGKCFLIDFDRDAYIAAMTGEEEDFFYSRQVLSEGVRLRCKSGRATGWCVVHDVDYFKYLLTKAGLFRRAREPQQIFRMHEELMRLLPFENLFEEEVEEIHPLEQGW